MSVVCQESLIWRLGAGPRNGNCGSLRAAPENGFASLFPKDGRRIVVEAGNLVCLEVPGLPDSGYPRLRRHPSEGDDGSGRLYHPLSLSGIHWAQARALEADSVLASGELISGPFRVGYKGSVIFRLAGIGFVEIIDPEEWPIALRGQEKWRFAAELRAGDELATGRRVNDIRLSSYIGVGWVAVSLGGCFYPFPGCVPLALK